MTGTARLLLAALLALAAAACDGDTERTRESDSTTTTSAATTTSAPAVSTTATTTATSGSTATTPPYGSACQEGSHPDCIDPDQDGRYEYLKGGAACMKEFGEDSGLCSDLDGDGVAGYPDSG